MNIFDPQVSGSLSVSGSGQISGDLTVLGTLFATVSGTTENAVSASHAAAYTLTSSFHQHTNSFNSFTSSYSTGSFTGSFVGNGSGLYNIPASGVTGLNLSQISQGIATASISQANGLLINTNTEITGNLKVNNINVGTNSLVTISVSDSGGKYFIDNVRNPQITLVKGFTYRFLYSNINAHPFRFSTTNDGSHNGGTVYSTGVTTGTSPNYIQIEVTDNTPSTLYYYCTAHPGMGSSISVVSDLMNLEADRGVVYIDPSRIATTGSNSFTGSQVISGSLSVTGSVNITGSISLNGQPIGTGKLDETVFNSYTSSNDPRVVALEVSTGSLNSFTSSIDTTIKNKMNTDGVMSSSIQVSITGTTDFTTFSTSISQSISNSLLDSKNYTDLQIALLDFASPLIPFEQFSSSINTYTSSANNRLNSIESTTGSLNTFTGSANSRITSLELASGSIRTDFNSYTSSNNTTNTTQNSRLTALESTSASVNSYTSSNTTNINAIHIATSSLNSFSSSLLGAVEITGSNLTVKGNLLVKGTTTQIDSTTLNIGDNIIQLNGTAASNAGLVVQDASGASTISGSLLWDTATDNWKAGKLGSEERIILLNEYNTFSTSIDSRVSSIQTATASLNSYTSSTNTRLGVIESTTSSLNTFTSSASGRLNSLETASGSIRTDFNSYTSSTNTRLGTIETSTGSLNSFTSSTNTRLGIIETSTGSLNSFTSSTNTRLGVIESTTSSLNTFTSSTNTRLGLIETSTGSLNSYTSSNNTRLGVIEATTSSLNTFTSSANTRLNSLETASGSIRTDFNSYTSSNNSTNTTQNSRLTSLETTTGSLNTYTSSNTTNINAIHTATGSLNTYTSSTNTRLGVIESTTSSLNSYTSSNNTRLGVIESTTASLNTYTSSNNTRLGVIESTTGSLNTFTSSANTRLNSLETASGSIRSDFNTYTSSNNSTNTTQNSRLSAIETSTGSLNTYTSSQNTINSSVNSTTSSLNSYTSSTNTRLGVIESTTASLNSYTSSTNSRLSAIETATSSLNSFTNSINTTIKNRLNTENVISGSAQVTLSSTTGYSTFSSSLATTDAGQDSRLNSIEGKTGSYATTGSNIFQGNQTITGSLYISQDLIVAGSSSIQNISSSIVNIADNIITVNALNPSLRFGGLAVIDSGSSPQVSGSMLFDSVNNQWIFVHQNQASVTSSVLLMGPETYNNLGGETYLTQNRIPKGTGIEHLNDSNITDTGTKVSINSNTEVTGTLVVTQNISSPNITAIQTATGSLNNFTSSLLTAIELTGSNLTVKGNLLVKGTTTNVNTTTLDVDNNLINLNGTGATFAGLRVKDTTAPNQISGSLLWDAINDYWVAGQLGSEQRIVRETEFNNAVTRIGNVEVSTSSLNSYTSSTNTRLGVIESTTSSLNSYTSSTNNRLNNIETSTGSLNSFTSSTNTRLSSLETASGSIRSDFNTYTSSNNTTNTTQNSRLTAIESTTGSLNTFTSSASSRLTTIESTTSSLNSYTSSNTTNINAIHTATASLNSYTSSTNTRLGVIESTTGSLNSFTSSTNTRLGVIESTTSSLNTFTSSANGRLNSLESASGSIRTDFNTYTSSNNSTNTTQNNRLNSIESTTGSLNSYTGSNTSNINAIHTATSSLNSYTSSNTTNINAIHTATASLNSYTSSTNTRLGTIESTTGSLNSYTSSNTTNINAIHTATSSLNSFTSSAGGRLSSIESTTGSLNSYTSSNTTSINAIHTATSSLNSFTNSFNTAFSLSGADVTVRGNFTVSGTTTTVNSTTVNIADNIIQLNGTGATNAGLVVRDATASTLTSGSLLWDTTNDKWIAGPLGAEDDVVLRTATQTLTNKTINASQLVDASVTNAKLANSAITIAGTSTSLGGTITAATILSGTGVVSGSAQLTSSFVQKAGDTMTGQLVIGSTGTAGSATLKVNTSTASAFIHSQENFSPNMTTGQTNILVVGASGSTKNSGYIGYNWVGAGSNSNYISLGHWGADHLLRIYGDGTVLMGTVTTGVWNGSSISTTYTDAKLTSVSGTTNQVNVSANTGAVTFSLPQNIHTGATPTFAGLTSTGRVQIGGSDSRGVLTVQTGSTETFTANTDPTDNGRFFVMQNTSTTNAAGQYSNITLQINPGGTIGTGRVLGDIRLVRNALNGTSARFVFGAFRTDATYKDYATIDFDAVTFAGTINGLTVSSGTITSGTWNGTAIGNAYLANSSFHIGTTSISLGRASASQTLTGISIDGNAGTVTDGAYLSTNNTFTGQNIFSNSSSDTLILRNTETQGVDKGAYLSFQGNDGTISTRTYGMISAVKENSTSGNYASKMIFWVRANGAALSEAITISSNRNVAFAATITSGTWNGSSIGTAYTDAKVTSISGTSNQITASASTGAITLSLPQNIHTGASPTFNRITTGGLYGTSTSGNIPIWQYDSGNPGYGIVYNEATPDTLRIDVSGQALTGTPDVLIGPDYIQVNGNTVYHTGNIPTWNQNTTGTASNITAFTINQSVGTANAPTFAGLTVGAGVATGRSAWGAFTNANIILTSSASDSTGNCGIEFRSGNNYPSDGASIYFENNAGGTSERAKLTLRVENDQEDFMELRAGRIDINSNTISGGGQSTMVNFQSAGSTVAYITSGGAIYARSGNLVKDFGNSTFTTSFTSVSSVTVTHNLGSKDVMVMVYDNNDEMFWPSSIVTTNTNVVTITFAANRTGRVVVLR